MGKALQRYEKNKANPVAASRALLEVDATRKRAIALCDSRHAETKSALQNVDALDFAVKVNQPRVVQEEIGKITKATDKLQSLVVGVPKLVAQH